MTVATLNVPTLLPPDAGTWREVEGGYELRFERRLRHSPDKVWRAIATPEGIACWFANADMDAEAGGRYHLTFQHPCTDDYTEEDQHRVQPNVVRVYDPPRVFEHTFEQTHIVRWELHPDGDGTWLVMTHHVPTDAVPDMKSYLSGWTQHLRGLEAAIHGQATQWNWDEWRALRDAYEAQLKAES